MKTLAIKKTTKATIQNKKGIRIVKKLRTAHAKDTFDEKEKSIKELLKRVDAKKTKKAS